MHIFIPPEEIIQYVIGFLDRDSLHNCRQVCKLFYYSAIPIYLEEIKLWGNHHLFLESIHEKLYYGKPLGKYVKRLSIKTPKHDYPQLCERKFHELIKNLPHLDTLQFNDAVSDQCSATNRYINFLGRLPTVLLPSLKHLVFSEALLTKFLEYDNYLDVCYRLRKQLVTASFCLEESSKLNSHSTDMKFFSEFTSLQYLSLDGDTGHYRDMHIPRILYCCPNLKSLVLSANQSWVFDQDNAEFSYNNLSYPALETLRLVVVHMTLPLLDYIKNYLPNLKQLDIEFILPDWVKLYSSLDDQQKNELTSYWMSLDCISFEGLTITSDLNFLSNYPLDKSRLKELYKSGYTFSFARETHERCCSHSTISIDNKNKRVNWSVKETTIYGHVFSGSDWMGLTSIAPLTVIDIKSPRVEYDFYFKQKELSALARNNSELSRISVFTENGKFYLGPAISTDRLYEETIDSPSFEVKKFKEPMVMLFLSYTNLSDELLKTIAQVSDQIQTIVLSKWPIPKDTLDLRVFKKMRKLIVDLYMFETSSTEKYYIRYSMDGKDKIVDSQTLIERADIDNDLNIQVAYAKSNRVILEFNNKL